jgi:hypothetical protein
VPIEVRGENLVGAVNEVDQVRVEGTWREGETLRVGWVRNLTTGAVVGVKKDVKRVLERDI